MGDARSRHRGVAAVSVASVLTGTIGTVAQLAPAELSPMALAAWSSLLGAIGLVVVFVLRQQAPLRYRLPVRWLVLGALGVAASHLAFFAAVEHTGVAVATLVTVGTAPLVAGLMDWIVARQRPTRHWLSGVVIALAGFVLLFGGAAQAVGSGVALAVLAGCGIPCQGFAAQQLMMDRPPLVAMAALVGGGAIVLLPVALMEAGNVWVSVVSVATVLYLGLVTVTFTNALLGFGLKRLRLRAVVVVGLLEPAVAVTLALTVLAEPATAALLVGVCLVILGVAVAVLDPSSNAGTLGPP